jgi:hypothetical protein
MLSLLRFWKVIGRWPKRKREAKDAQCAWRGSGALQRIFSTTSLYLHMACNVVLYLPSDEECEEDMPQHHKSPPEIGPRVNFVRGSQTSRKHADACKRLRAAGQPCRHAKVTAPSISLPQRVKNPVAGYLPNRAGREPTSHFRARALSAYCVDFNAMRDPHEHLAVPASACVALAIAEVPHHG